MRIRSGYSFKLAYGHLKDVSSRLSEIGWKYQPISDRDSTFSFTRWSKIVKNPIYGVEIAVVKNLGDKRRASSNYFTFFALNDLRVLHELIGKATSHEARTPELTYADAVKAKGVIKIAGEFTELECLRSASIKDLYIALSPATPLGLYKQAKKRGFKFIACSENYYPRAEDKETYRVAVWKSNTQTYPLYILSDAEWDEAVWFASTADKSAALANRDIAMSRCRAKLTKATLVKPKRTHTLLQLCQAGAKRIGVNLLDPVYAERLRRELKLINEKAFEDYFFIIADIIKWAKERMLVGPARGSSCGSLVCYLLDITTVDPIKFDLIFERFIDINRNDLPDIDIDFSDTWRKLTFDYIEQTYGTEHTARLGTVSMFRPRSALGAAGKSMFIPNWKIDKVTDSLIVRSSGDARALQTLEDTLNETEPGRAFLKEYPNVRNVLPLEGHPTNASQHAAGVVITEDPIDNYVAIDYRTNRKNADGTGALGVAMCDKKDAEDLGMLKIDMLGLTQLSIFERTLELAGLMGERSRDKRIRLKDGRQITDYFSDLPLDDKAAFKVLNDHKYSGIFQFAGMSLKSTAIQVEIDHIEDMISLTALARPGPLASGGVFKWIARRNGKEPVTYPHPLLEPYLKSTLGIVIYQEQVMQMGREVGDLSWEDVTSLRKSMSKSLGKEYFDQWGDKWKSGAIRKGMPEAVANKYWDDMCGFGNWAFNRAHSVAYGLVSYYSCYLKAHYPSEFAAATLDAEKDPHTQMILLRELTEEGVKYKPVDIERSIERWTIDKDGTLLGPLTQIKGIGSKTVNEIIDNRKNGTNLKPSVSKKLAEAKTPIDSLYPVQDALGSMDLSEKNIVSTPQRIRDLQINGTNQNHKFVIGVITKIGPKDENEAVNVAKRGGKKVVGPSIAATFWVADDTDEIYCKVDRTKFAALKCDKLFNEAKVGKTLIAVKGSIPRSFRMISVDRFRVIGDLDSDLGGFDAGGQGGVKGSIDP